MWSESKMQIEAGRCNAKTGRLSALSAVATRLRLVAAQDIHL